MGHLLISALWLCIFVLLFGGAVAWIQGLRELLRRLKVDHRALYDRMGSPSLVANNSFATMAPLLRLVLEREPPSPELSEICRHLRAIFWALLVGLLAIFALSLAAIVSR